MAHTSWVAFCTSCTIRPLAGQYRKPNQGLAADLAQLTQRVERLSDGLAACKACSGAAAAAAAAAKATAPGPGTGSGPALAPGEASAPASSTAASAAHGAAAAADGAG